MLVTFLNPRFLSWLSTHPFVLSPSLFSLSPSLPLSLSAHWPLTSYLLFDVQYLEPLRPAQMFLGCFLVHATSLAVLSPRFELLWKPHSCIVKVDSHGAQQSQPQPTPAPTPLEVMGGGAGSLSPICHPQFRLKVRIAQGVRALSLNPPLHTTHRQVWMQT